MSNLNFLLGVGITGDKWLMFIRYDVTVRAGQGAIHQLAIRGIHNKYVECSRTYDTPMYLNFMYIFRHILSLIKPTPLLPGIQISWLRPDSIRIKVGTFDRKNASTTIGL